MQITAVAVAWLNAAYTYRAVLTEVISPIVFALAIVGISAVVMVLVFFISRRRSSDAKWTLVVLSVAGSLGWVEVLRRWGVPDWAGALSLFQAALQIASLWQLMTAPATAYLTSGRTAPEEEW